MEPSPSSSKTSNKKSRKTPRTTGELLGVTAVEELVTLGPPELLLPFMRCSFCKGSQAHEAYSCLQGHIVCFQCRSNVNECPFYTNASSPSPIICGAPYRSRTNPLYRAVYLQSRVVCTNPGCTAYLRGKSITEHKRSCQYTTTLTCSWRDVCGSKGVRFPDAPRHLKTHGVPQYNSTWRIYAVRFDPAYEERGSVPGAMIKYEEDTFALMTYISKEITFVYICNLKSMKEAKRTLQATVSVIGTNGERLEHSGRIRCYGERGILMSNSTCVYLPDSLLKSAFLHTYDRDQKKVLIVQVLIHEPTKWKPAPAKEEEKEKKGLKTGEGEEQQPQSDSMKKKAEEGQFVATVTIVSDRVKKLRDVLMGEGNYADTVDSKKEEEDRDEAYAAFLSLLISSST